MNLILNLFFTSFWSLFFIPLVEINSGIFTVGANSFLVIDRNLFDFGKKNKLEMLFSSIGLILTNLSCFLILYCFRNYEFECKNVVKRRFRMLLLL